ncbi:hypothetical protein JCM8547_001660 [Rhodosporidiobolus lusitaniae]
MLTKPAPLVDLQPVSSRSSTVKGGGHIQRNISALGLVGVSLEILNGWMSISSSIIIGLSQGGTVVVLYGLIGLTLVNLCIAGTLAEMASAVPTAGGQYVWSALFSPKSTRRAVSFATGFVSLFAWCLTTASVCTTVAQYIFAIVLLWHPAFNVERWMVFLLYIAVLLLFLSWNVFLTVRTPWLGNIFIWASSAIFIAIIASCLTLAPSYQPSSAVWSTYTNEIGWTSSFVVVATGLTNPGYVFLGIDATVHLAEDSTRPARDVPIALFSSVASAFVTAFSTGVVLAYCVQDYTEAASSLVPFLSILHQATQSRAGATALFACATISFSIAGNACIHTVSRLLWSLANDRALPLHSRLRSIHPTLQVPVWSILASAIPVIICGVLYVASTTAYNSIVSCAIILSYISFAIPTVVLMLDRRRSLDPTRRCRLGVLGWVANSVVVLWTVFTTVMWLFPLTPDPDASEMNFAIVVLGVLAVLGAALWFLYARRHFHGPTLDDLVIHLSKADSRIAEEGHAEEKEASG